MEEPDDRPARMDRRTFLRRTSGATLFGVGALRQDDEGQVRRKFLLRRVARFERDDPGDDYVGRGMLVTTKANVAGQPEGEIDCEFPDWDPESFVKYQVLLFDPNRGIITESRAFIAADADPIPTGTPYLINVEVPCSGRYVGIEGENVPGRLVE